MKYISVGTFAEKYGISERTARNYCATGKIEGAFLTGKTWNILYKSANKSSIRRIFSANKANILRIIVTFVQIIVVYLFIKEY